MVATNGAVDMLIANPGVSSRFNRERMRTVDLWSRLAGEVDMIGMADARPVDMKNSLEFQMPDGQFDELD